MSTAWRTLPAVAVVTSTDLHHARDLRLTSLDPDLSVNSADLHPVTSDPQLTSGDGYTQQDEPDCELPATEPDRRRVPCAVYEARSRDCQQGGEGPRDRLQLRVWLHWLRYGGWSGASSTGSQWLSAAAQAHQGGVLTTGWQHQGREPLHTPAAQVSHRPWSREVLTWLYHCSALVQVVSWDRD